MKNVLPEVKAKFEPMLDEAKKDLKPVSQALAYLVCWSVGLLMLPFAVLQELCKKFSKKYEPAPKEEPKP